jgi:hypothetical protein
MVDILYNACFGGWTLSEKAIGLYNARMKEIDATFKPMSQLDFCRHDPILVNIYYELGKEFDGSCSETQVETIPAKYKNYYSITDFDGNETVEIHTSECELDELKEQITALLKNSMTTDAEKIREVQKLLDASP